MDVMCVCDGQILFSSEIIIDISEPQIRQKNFWGSFYLPPATDFDFIY